MKAVIVTQYGSPDVLKVQEIQKPIPNDHEILIKVHATSVGYGDLLGRNFSNISSSQFNMPFIFWFLAKVVMGWSTPKIQVLGSEFSGIVESVGKTVTKFKTGDAVFGTCGQSYGAYAEYVCLSQDGLVTHKPTNLSHEEAAIIPYGASTAYSLLTGLNLQHGQKVLINGASGSIGSATVQLAKYFGAEVTGVCSTPRMDYVKALGADHIIDYTQQDFTQNGETYDVIFDVLGRGSFNKAKNSLKPQGRYVYASFKMKQVFQMLWTSIRGDKRVLCILSGDSQKDLIEIKKLIETGKFKAMVDRSYPLDKTAEAHWYVEKGSKRAGVAITVVPQT
jgi:NADPH:quinone reductase-like Zn-dependent oxidoreductase